MLFGFIYHVKIDLEAKVANFELHTIGCASQVHLDAMKTIGTHNYHNASVAMLSIIGLDIGINACAISSVIGELRSPPHRMQIGKLKLVSLLINGDDNLYGHFCCGYCGWW